MTDAELQAIVVDTKLAVHQELLRLGRQKREVVKRAWAWGLLALGLFAIGVGRPDAVALVAGFFCVVMLIGVMIVLYDHVEDELHWRRRLSYWTEVERESNAIHPLSFTYQQQHVRHEA